ncbi:MAG: Rrf2 family transcriptional regulator [Blautia sp.]|nr:Rrf2 family transcriptional regulator [Blautia sp.]MDY5031141.1 Rrf2 family transcriptional regulator [Blautia sp.]
MNFSKRSRYGIRALIDLAQNTEAGCVQLSDIADRNCISVKYLEQIFSGLRKAGILRSVKGPQGGYLLAKEPSKLKIADVILALDGSYFLEKEECQDDEKGKAEALAVQTDIIDPINQYIHQFLNTLTLQTLVESSEGYKALTGDMYYI